MPFITRLPGLCPSSLGKIRRHRAVEIARPGAVLQRILNSLHLNRMAGNNVLQSRFIEFTSSRRRIASFAALATRNLRMISAGIFIFCFVEGLIPVRAFLLRFTNFPNPGTTNSPLFSVVLLAMAPSVSRNALAVFYRSAWLRQVRFLAGRVS